MLTDYLLLTAKPPLENSNGVMIVGGSQSKTSDSFTGTTPQHGVQVVKLVNVRQVLVVMNGCLVGVPEARPGSYVAIKRAQGSFTLFLRVLGMELGATASRGAVLGGVALDVALSILPYRI